MRKVHLAISVFQGVLSDVEVHDEAEPAQAKIQQWITEGDGKVDASYMEKEVLTQGIPIRELGLENGYYNALKRNRIRTVEHLCEMTERRLLRSRRIGPKCVRQVKEALAARGLALTED